MECDETPQAARTKLEGLLGASTAVVESGGEWTDPDDSSIIKPKVHLHWRLKKPTTTEEDHKLLREARVLATDLVGGDCTNIYIGHPIRWPGSWHRKNIDTPRLARIISFSNDNEIDLDEALVALRNAGWRKPVR